MRGKPERHQISFQDPAAFGQEESTRGAARGSMRVAIFDLDGTLADTSGDLIAAANGALSAAGWGMPLDPTDDRAIAFAGGRAMLREGLARRETLNEAEVDRLYPELLEIYGAKLAVHTRLYDGAEAALDRLAAAGWKLGICTNKPERLALLLVGELGLTRHFATLLGADSLPVRKPDPRHLLETIARAGGEPRRAVLVGDTVTDRDAARAAGVPCVLVGFGPEGGAISSLAPEAMIAHFDELPEVLERLVPAAEDGSAPGRD
jgi:phosphoglycolate phosphatase